MPQSVCQTFFALQRAGFSYQTLLLGTLAIEGSESRNKEVKIATCTAVPSENESICSVLGLGLTLPGIGRGRNYPPPSITLPAMCGGENRSSRLPPGYP